MVIQLYFKNHVKTLRKAKMDFLDCCYIIDGTGLTLHVAGLLDWLLLSFCLFLASYISVYVEQHLIYFSSFYS